MSLLLALAAASSALAPTTPQTTAAALADDGALYAALDGVPAEEAASRLSAAVESLAASDRVAVRYAGRLAGVTVVHSPELALRVLLTGADAAPDERFVARDGRVVPIRFVTGARATLSELRLALRTRAAALAAAIGGGRGIGIDQRRGELRLYLRRVPDRAEALAGLEARASTIMGVPVRISRIDQRLFDFQVAGGGRVTGTTGGTRYACTTGFLVSDGRRSAVTTAAHCPDALTYEGPNGASTALPMIGAWGARAYDVQLNAVTGTPAALFYADRRAGTMRQVSGWIARGSLRAGDLLCHWGEHSGHGCGDVELTDFAPPGELCAGPCEPLFVTVTGPACGRGDSGGPVFVGTLAVGITKGGTYAGDSGRCSFGFFQSVDYLPPGWHLLVAPVAARVRRSSVPTLRPSDGGPAQSPSTDGP